MADKQTAETIRAWVRNLHPDTSPFETNEQARKFLHALADELDPPVVKPTPRTKEENIEFRKQFDEKVDAGWSRELERLDVHEKSVQQFIKDGDLSAHYRRVRKVIP